MTVCCAPVYQRSHGDAHLSFGSADAGGHLKQLRQSGSAKAFFHSGAGGNEVMFLNTSGGLTGGDTLRYRLDVGAGSRVTATTQTAERAYLSNGGAATVEVSHSVGAGGHLDWLPQETILFDGSAVQRRTSVTLGSDASCLLLEAVVLGRAAMGETLASVSLHDRRMVQRSGQPVLVEPLHLSSQSLNAGLGVLEGARAVATVALVMQGAEDATTAARNVLDEPGVTAAASGFDGKLLVRLMAVDGWPLRRQILRLLMVLRTAPLPRVWQM